MGKHGGNQGGGQNKVVLTEKQVIEVKALSACLSVEQIADYLEITHDTFTAICKRDPRVLRAYKNGRADSIDKMGKSLMLDALAGDVTSRIFYLKTQAGWSEKKELDLNVQGKVENDWTVTFKDGIEDDD